MATKIVVAVENTTFFIGTQRVHVHAGTAWASDSPAVTARPELFSDNPDRALGGDLVPEGPTVTVEDKTAAPGQKSGARRLLGRR